MQRKEERDQVEKNLVVMNEYLADYFDVLGVAERPPIEVLFKVKDRSTAGYMRLIVPMMTLRENEGSALAQKLKAQDVAGQLMTKRNLTWRDEEVQKKSAA